MAAPGLAPTPPRSYVGERRMNFFARLRYLHRARKARRRGERNEIQAILEIVRPGDTVLDIGAHKGSYLYWLRQAVGESGRVFAFEPQPALATYLDRKSTRLNSSHT